MDRPSKNTLNEDWIVTLRKRHQELLAIVGSEERRLALAQLEKIEALLGEADPRWKPPTGRLAHLRPIDAAAVILREYGGAMPYGTLIRRMWAEGVASATKKREGRLKYAVNHAINDKGWFECSLETSAPDVEKATVKITKAFEEYCKEGGPKGRNNA
jgi:hypothetical protein